MGSTFDWQCWSGLWLQVWTEAWPTRTRAVSFSSRAIARTPEIRGPSVRLYVGRGIAIVSRAPTKLHSAVSCGSQSGIHSLSYDLTFERRNRYSQGRQAAVVRQGLLWRVSIDTLCGCNQSNALALQFVDNERQMGQRSSQAVELEYDDPLNLAGAHGGHYCIQARPDKLGPGNLVRINLEIAPAAPSTVGTQFVLLAVGCLVSG